MSEYAKEFFGGQSEARQFAREMVLEGVPRRSIFLEEAATNTNENVRLGFETLRKRVRGIQRMVLVTHPYHSRRCLRTFQQLFPTIALGSCPPPGSPIDYIRNRTKVQYARRILAELDRLRVYGTRGHLVPDTIPDRVSRAERNLRSLLGL